MKTLIGNKKGADYFTFLLTVFAIAVLVFILIGLTMKYNKLTNTIPGAGSSAASILSTYSAADAALLYLDNAARLSMQNATYLFAYEGFHSPNPASCGVHDNYRKWSMGSAIPAGDASCEAKLSSRCIPKESTAFNGFERYVRENLDSQIAAYNESGRVNLTAGNYDDLTLIDTGRELQIVGKAKETITVNNSRIYYGVMPSFRENINVDLISNFKELAGTGGKGGEFLDFIENRTWRVQDDPVVTKPQLENVFDDYSKESGELDWVVDSYDTRIDGDCNTGAECSIQCCEGEGERRSCWTVKGVWHQLYRNYDLDVDIKIVDDNYKLEGEKKGYKGFATSESGSPEEKDYTYRFASHWVTMTPQKYCDAHC